MLEGRRTTLGAAMVACLLGAACVSNTDAGPTLPVDAAPADAASTGETEETQTITPSPAVEAARREALTTLLSGDVVLSPGDLAADPDDEVATAVIDVDGSQVQIELSDWTGDGGAVPDVRQSATISLRSAYTFFATDVDGNELALDPAAAIDHTATSDVSLCEQRLLATVVYDDGGTPLYAVGIGFLGEETATQTVSDEEEAPSSTSAGCPLFRGEDCTGTCTLMAGFYPIQGRCRTFGLLNCACNPLYQIRDLLPDWLNP